MRRLSAAARLAALLPLLLAVQPGAAASSWSKGKDAAVEASSSAVQAMLDQHAQKMNSESCCAASGVRQHVSYHVVLPLTSPYVPAPSLLLLKHRCP